MSLSNLKLHFLRWRQRKNHYGPGKQDQQHSTFKSDPASQLLSSQLLSEKISSLISSRPIFGVLTTVELRSMIFSYLAPGDIRNLCKDLLLFVPRRDIAEWLSPFRLLVPDPRLLSRLSREGYKLTLLSASKDMLMYGSKAIPSDNFTVLPAAILVVTKAGLLVLPDNDFLDTFKINHTSTRVSVFLDSTNRKHSTRAMTVDCWFGGQMALWMAFSAGSITEPITLSPRALISMTTGYAGTRHKAEPALYYHYFHDSSGRISGPILHSKKREITADRTANSLCVEFPVMDRLFRNVVATALYNIPDTA